VRRFSHDRASSQMPADRLHAKVRRLFVSEGAGASLARRVCGAFPEKLKTRRRKPLPRAQSELFSRCNQPNLPRSISGCDPRNRQTRLLIIEVDDSICSNATACSFVMAFRPFARATVALGGRPERYAVSPWQPPSAGLSLRRPWLEGRWAVRRDCRLSQKTKMPPVAPRTIRS
jgi:hypothetical protein